MSAPPPPAYGHNQAPLHDFYPPPPNTGSYPPPPGQQSFPPPGQQQSFTPPVQQQSFTPPTQPQSFPPPTQQQSFTPPAQPQSFPPPPSSPGFPPPPGTATSYPPPPNQPSPANNITSFPPPPPPQTDSPSNLVASRKKANVTPIKLNNAAEPALKSPGYDQAMKSPGFAPLNQQALMSPGLGANVQPIKLNNAAEPALKSPGYDQAMKSPGFAPLNQQALMSPGLGMDNPLKSPAFPPQEPPPPGGHVGGLNMGEMGRALGGGVEKPMNDDDSTYMPGGAPSATHFVGAMATQDDVGTFNGGSYRISHRDANTILTIQLAKLAPLHAKPGVMIAMSHSVIVKGAVKFSMKKFITGAEMTSSEYLGPGEILFAPPFLGDITPLRLTGSEEWRVGKDAFIASTKGVQKEMKRQNFSKAMFSGEGLFTYNVKGNGILWFASFGAIVRKDLHPGEIYMVDNGHLVAWNLEYDMARVAGGGFISGISSGEGLACKFVGPGTIFLQTRNPQMFAAWASAYAA